MPLSEFYRMARGKLESAQRKSATCSTDISHVRLERESEIAELVWENGQIMTQGQSSRAGRSPTSNNFPSQCPKLREKDLGSCTNPKTAKFGVMDSVLTDFDDDLVPWLNYPVDDSLQNDYSSGLLPGISGVTVNELSAQNTLSSFDKRITSNQVVRGSHVVPVHDSLNSELANGSKVEVGEPSRSRSGQSFPRSFQESQTSGPSLRSGVSGIINDNNSNIKHVISGNSIQSQASAQKQDSGLPNYNISSGFMNFSHFSRPAALVRANLQNVGSMTTLGTSMMEGTGSKNKGTDPSSGKLAESTQIDLKSGLGKEVGFSNNLPNLVPPKVDSKQVVTKPPEDLRTAEESEAVSRVDAVKNDKLPNQVLGDKNMELAAAASSVCSGNSFERASNDPTHNLKRKCRETDESEGRSEDLEEESVGVRKAASARGGAGSKRSRAAEVHNLSERRRRDRINEKMRALQELIPNCNKVDKASMLDEAIEYLKTLQLQVQMMSVGTGLYMPPMMLPTGMQHVHAAHMAHFSPMAVGIGMGMGFGMGMMDLNGGSHGYPMLQVPRMQGAHFPGQPPSPSSRPISFQGMAGPNLPVFGHPGQGLPVAAPQGHLVPLPGGVPVNSTMGLSASGVPVPLQVPNPAPPSNAKDLIQNTKSQIVDNTNASSSMNQRSIQCQTINKGPEQSAPMLRTNQASDAGGSEDIGLTKGNDIAPSRPDRM